MLFSFLFMRSLHTYSKLSQFEFQGTKTKIGDESEEEEELDEESEVRW